MVCKTKTLTTAYLAHVIVIKDNISAYLAGK